MFTEMVDSVKRDAVRYLFRVELAKPKTEPQRVGAWRRRSAGARLPATMPVSVDKVGRNDPCPCGSGKKYKSCHGAAWPSCRARRRVQSQTMTTETTDPKATLAELRSRLVEAARFL